jgi:hypothetical protein
LPKLRVRTSRMLAERMYGARYNRSRSGKYQGPDRQERASKNSPSRLTGGHCDSSSRGTPAADSGLWCRVGHFASHGRWAGAGITVTCRKSDCLALAGLQVVINFGSLHCHRSSPVGGPCAGWQRCACEMDRSLRADIPAKRDNFHHASATETLSPGSVLLSLAWEGENSQRYVEYSSDSRNLGGCPLRDRHRRANAPTPSPSCGQMLRTSTAVYS